MIDKNKLIQGKKKENKIEKYLSSKGWRTKKNIFYDNHGVEVAQFIVVDGYSKSYPDLTIEKNKNSISIKYLIEVKSLEAYYLNKRASVTVPCYQFLSYKNIQKIEDIPVYIFFIVYYRENDYAEEWYRQSLDNLDKTKTYIEDAYKDEDKHFIWTLDKLKIIESHR